MITNKDTGLVSPQFHVKYDKSFDTVQQNCARYSSSPKTEHGAAVKWIGRYLKGSSKHGMIYKPDESKGLEVHVDAEFVGN